jgi:hypothetical protein
VFSPGEISPYQIIMASEKPGGVWSQHYFDTQIKVVNDLVTIHFTQSKFCDHIWILMVGMDSEIVGTSISATFRYTCCKLC